MCREQNLAKQNKKLTETSRNYQKLTKPTKNLRNIRELSKKRLRNSNVFPTTV